MSLPLPKIAWIHWKDACFQTEGAVLLADVTGPMDMFSCGVFVKETAEYIAIAIDGDADHGFRLVQTIPKVNVIKYKIIDPEIYNEPF